MRAHCPPSMAPAAWSSWARRANASTAARSRFQRVQGVGVAQLLARADRLDLGAPALQRGLHVHGVHEAVHQRGADRLIERAARDRPHRALAHPPAPALVGNVVAPDSEALAAGRAPRQPRQQEAVRRLRTRPAPRAVAPRARPRRPAPRRRRPQTDDALHPLPHRRVDHRGHVDRAHPGVRAPFPGVGLIQRRARAALHAPPAVAGEAREQRVRQQRADGGLVPLGAAPARHRVSASGGPAALSSREAASRIGTDARTLRRFLRSTGAGVGEGKRYEIAEDALPDLERDPPRLSRPRGDRPRAQGRRPRRGARRPQARRWAQPDRRGHDRQRLRRRRRVTRRSSATPATRGVGACSGGKIPALQHREEHVRWANSTSTKR